MKWTREKPKETGWYWVHTRWATGDHKFMYHFDVPGAGVDYMVNDKQTIAWAGPIPEPEEDTPRDFNTHGYGY